MVEVCKFDIYDLMNIMLSLIHIDMFCKDVEFYDEESFSLTFKRLMQLYNIITNLYEKEKDYS